MTYDEYVSLYVMGPRVYRTLSRINAARCAEIEGKAAGEGFSLGDWGNALAGECGELCNILKKIRRIDLGIKTKAPQDREKLLKEAAEEIADVYLYLDLVATKLGVQLLAVTQEKFNKDSEKYQLPHRI